ncbi:hypothetical protein LCGC14_2895930 [marine sediment metagenome]|uniref:Uncharacterized protein n=1 Tax=marine sediment metagenome TaxID=412755 RepID=A0A0F9A3Q3_9ZZZZ
MSEYMILLVVVWIVAIVWCIGMAAMAKRKEDEQRRDGNEH